VWGDKPRAKVSQPQPPAQEATGRSWDPATQAWLHDSGPFSKVEPRWENDFPKLPIIPAAEAQVELLIEQQERLDRTNNRLAWLVVGMWLFVTVEVVETILKFLRWVAVL
jgi:hypothetical protein